MGWNSVHSRAGNAIIRDEVEASGGEIVGEEYVLPNSAEVTRMVRTIAQTEPDLIFSITFRSDAYIQGCLGFAVCVQRPADGRPFDRCRMDYGKILLVGRSW